MASDLTWQPITSRNLSSIIKILNLRLIIKTTHFHKIRFNRELLKSNRKWDRALRCRIIMSIKAKNFQLMTISEINHLTTQGRNTRRKRVVYNSTMFKAQLINLLRILKIITRIVLNISFSQIYLMRREFKMFMRHKTSFQAITLILIWNWSRLEVLTEWEAWMKEPITIRNMCYNHSRWIPLINIIT